MKRMKRTLVVGTAIAALVIGSVVALGAGNGWWKTAITEQSTLPVEVQEAVLEALVGARRVCGLRDLCRYPG